MSDKEAASKPGKIYLDAPYVRITWDADIQAVYVKWKAWANSSEYRAAQEVVILALRENQAARNLVDSTDRRVLADDDQKWLVEDWMPRATAAGRRWTAIVMPKSALGRTIAENIDNSGRSELNTIEHFETVEEAKAWLSTVN